MVGRKTAGGLLAIFSSVLGAQTPAFTLGFEERARLEDWNNLADFADAKRDGRTQYRFRTRLWTEARWGDAIGVSAGLDSEYRWIRRPDLPVPSREVCFDRLHVDWKPSRSWSVRIGRQDLMRGEGFILFDGTPLDGGRSTFFDAAVATWSGSLGRLEALLIRNGRTERWLPRFNEPRDPKDQQRLAEWDEHAFGFYFMRPGFVGARGQLEAYALRLDRSRDYRAPGDPAARPDRVLDLAGSRVVAPLGEGWAATAEGALQRGSQRPTLAQGGGDLPLRAWGGYGRLKRVWDAPWKPSVSLGGVALSGDDPSTRSLEGWDPVFGRWPKWSELYVYTLAGESGVAAWSNLGMSELEGRLTPRPGLDLRVTWYRMRAFRSWAAKGAAFGPGRMRGDLFQARVDLALSAHWKGHVVYERLLPGDFHAGRGAAHFLRFEVTGMASGTMR